jgi:anti-sigma factor RsiW
MIALRRRRPLVCQELVELVTDYLEGALSLVDRARFEAHLAGCPHCTVYIEQFRETLRLTGTLRASDVSPEAAAALLEQFAAWKREDS